MAEKLKKSNPPNIKCNLLYPKGLKNELNHQILPLQHFLPLEASKWPIFLHRLELGHVAQLAAKTESGPPKIPKSAGNMGQKWSTYHIRHCFEIH
jgi:hypothetical protein